MGASKMIVWFDESEVVKAINRKSKWAIASIKVLEIHVVLMSLIGVSFVLSLALIDGDHRQTRYGTR